MSTVSPVSSTSTTPIDNTERLRRQQAVDGAIAQLAYNTYIGADGKSVNMLSKYELPDLMAARGPVADQIRALLSVSPALSSTEIKNRATALVSQYRSQFPVAPRVTTTTTQPATTTAPTLSTRDRLLRQQALDQSLGQLRYNAFPDASGKTVNLLRSGFTLSQINERRGSFETQLRALHAQQPPLTPEQIRTQGTQIVNQFRATFGGGATATTATTAAAGTDQAARQAALDAALAKLRGVNSAVDGDKTYQFVDILSQSDVDAERQQYVDQINALMNEQPPLSPEEITAKADAITNTWTEHGMLYAAMVEQFVVQMYIQNYMQMMQAFNQM